MVCGRGTFKYEKSYGVAAKIFGHEFSLARFPPDPAYSFLTILVSSYSHQYESGPELI
jgi:hypothetical protein